MTALAEAAQPGAPVWLAGHSLGSAAAAVSAVRDPGRYLDELAYDPLAFTSAAGARSIAAVLTAAWAELAGGLAQVPLPVLLVHGADDPMVPAAHARDWAGRLKRGQLAEFAGARHDVLNETVHREVAAAISAFIVSGGAAAPGFIA